MVFIPFSLVYFKSSSWISFGTNLIIDLEIKGLRKEDCVVQEELSCLSCGDLEKEQLVPMRIIWLCEQRCQYQEIFL